MRCGCRSAPPALWCGTTRRRLTDEPTRVGHIMRGRGGGWVRGRQRRLFLPGLPEDFERWSLPGWSWNDVLPHFRAIETRSGLRRTAARIRRPDTRAPRIRIRRLHRLFRRCRNRNGISSGSPISTARCADRPLPAGVGAVPLNIDGGMRIGPGGAFLQPALDRPNLTLLADTRVSCGSRSSVGVAVGADCVGPDGPVRLIGRSDRVVRRRNRVRTSPDAVRYRARGCAGSRGHPGCRDSPVGHADERSPRMGAAGGLDADPRPAAGGGDAHHAERARDQAVHKGLRRHGGGRRRRSGRSAAHRRRADATPVARAG